MVRVGIVGWRGMVGSVLVQRMREEGDFDLIEPVFFSTSQAGGRGPAIGKDAGVVQDAMDLDELRALPVIIVSSMGSGKDRRRGLEVGADAYLAKGELNQRSLVEAVERLVGD